jgi:hypothetical protein
MVCVPGFTPPPRSCGGEYTETKTATGFEIPAVWGFRCLYPVCSTASELLLFPRMQSLLGEPWLDRASSPDYALFTSIVAPGHNWAPAAIGSVVLHLLAVVCSVLLQTYLPLLHPESLDGLRTVSLIPLRSSQRLYYFVEPRDPPPVQRAAAPAPSLARPAPRRAGLRLPPGITLPPLPQPPRANSILVQPSTSLADIVAPLPAVTAWTPRERPAPRTFIQPGRASTTPETQTLDAPPSLDRPSVEPFVSDVKIPRLPRLYAPALQLAPASTAPVRLLDAPRLSSETENAGIGRAGGDPANLIAAGLANLPPNTYANVPPGVAGAPAGDGPAGAGGEGGAAGGRRGGAGDSASASSGGGNSPGSGRGPANSPARGGVAGANASSGSRAASTEVALEVEPALPPGTRRITRPKDGRYTFMVMGSKPGEAFPETEGLLSGTLVYTVYLGVGTRPDWVLQYCLPKASESVESGARSRVDPPFAFSMARPEVTFESGDDRVFVHGMIDFTGKFQQLALVGDAAVGNWKDLLAALSLWQFRPAMRDGRPIAVEVLLIIPRPQA